MKRPTGPHHAVIFRPAILKSSLPDSEPKHRHPEALEGRAVLARLNPHLHRFAMLRWSLAA